MTSRRSSSLTDLVGSPRDSSKPFIYQELQEKVKKRSLRRSMSSPEKRMARQSQKINPEEWRSVWDKERGYVTDLIADGQPVTRQPQLSYFSYLGSSFSSKGHYQAVSSDAEVIINMTNAIFVVEKAPSTAQTIDELESKNIVLNKSSKTDRTQLVECFTCMCCVKAVFYHCTEDGEFERNWADEPCACEMPWTDCAVRWSFLGIFSTFLPCLVCYPVAKLCCSSTFALSRK